MPLFPYSTSMQSVICDMTSSQLKCITRRKQNFKRRQVKYLNFNRTAVITTPSAPALLNDFGELNSLD